MSLKKTWSEGVAILLKNPALGIPFLFLALFEGAILSICYYFPRPPVSAVLAPPVKVFIGEQFLFYPLNFLVLPRLMFLGRCFVYMGIGLICMGMTILALTQVKNGEAIRPLGNFNHSIRRYWSLFLSAVLYCVFAAILYKLPQILALKLFSGKSAFPAIFWMVRGCSFFALIMLETFLIYLPVYFLVKKSSFIEAFKNLKKISKKLFLLSLSSVFSLRLFNMIMIILRANLAVIVQKFFPLFPEFYLVFLGLEICAFFFVNLCVVVLATNVFIEEETGS